MKLLQLLLVAFMVLANGPLVLCQDDDPYFNPIGFEMAVALIEAMMEVKCPDFKKGRKPPSAVPMIHPFNQPPVWEPIVDLTIAPMGNNLVGATEINAIMVNNNPFPIQIFQPGSILDKRPIYKTNVYYTANDTLVPYAGIDVTERLTTDEHDWFYIGSHQSARAQFDAADTYDLSSGGDYSYQIDTYAHVKKAATGVLVQAAVHLLSNMVSVKNVNGALAAEGLAAQGKYEDGAKTDLEVTGRGCDERQKKLLDDAKLWAIRMAVDGAWHAIFSGNGNAEYDMFVEFFHTDDNLARCFVTENLIKIARKLLDQTPGSIINCYDTRRICNGDRTLVYSSWAGRRPSIHFCPDALGPLAFAHSWVAGLPDIAMALFVRVGSFAIGRGALGRILFEDVNGLPQAAMLPWELARRNADTWAFYLQWCINKPDWRPVN